MSQNLVHSIFAGFTNFTSGFIERNPVIIPIDHIENLGKRKVDPKKDNDYITMMTSTGQASFDYLNCRLIRPTSMVHSSSENDGVLEQYCYLFLEGASIMLGVFFMTYF